MLPKLGSSQISYDFGFQRNDSIIVLDSLGNNMKFPWVGGLNAVQFQEIDMNLDGIKDLLVFDVHGDKKYTFINDGVANQVSYRYEPKYEKLFPKLISWVQLVDYNGDGKNDIFTYFPGGIKVYKNISESSTGLKFQLITNMINYIAPNGMGINIFVSSVDYPAISDIDNDGDLDILTFHILGTFVVYYKNMSMEIYGDRNHLEFKEKDKCWGKFAESSDNNIDILNVFCNYKSNDIDSSKTPKHTGSTLLALDIDSDTVKDLLLGDVDYFTINLLKNGGTLDSAYITSKDTNFPSYDTAINIVTFPVMNFVDVNNDGVKDLTVSPFDPSYYKANAINSVWYYKNNGTNSSPVFHLKQKNFFQDQMIDNGDNAMPEVVDVNGDGLMDIIMTNYGIVDSAYLDSSWFFLITHKISTFTYYKNIGTTNVPKFQFMDGNWKHFSALNLLAAKATFGDLDNDGDTDMIVGSSDGKLIYFENTANAGNSISFATPVYNYKNIDVGEFSAPKLFDIDGDSLLDLTIGTKHGWLSYYKNVGSKTVPQFNLITDSMGNAHTVDYWNSYEGYAVPEIYKDDSNNLVMMVGSASGKVFYYRDILNNITGNFGIDTNLVYYGDSDTLHSVAYFINSGELMEIINSGMRSAPAVYDFNNDGLKDMIVGTFSGGLNFYNGRTPAGVGFPKGITPKSFVRIYPNPTKDFMFFEIENSNFIKEINIKVYSITGDLLASQTFQNTLQGKLNLSNLKKGIYFLNLKTTDNSGRIEYGMRKFIIL